MRAEHGALTRDAVHVERVERREIVEAAQVGGAVRGRGGFAHAEVRFPPERSEAVGVAHADIDDRPRLPPSTLVDPKEEHQKCGMRNT